MDRDGRLRRGNSHAGVELADYLNQFAELGIQEVLITPIGTERTLDGFMDRFDKEVRPRLQ